MESPDDSRVHHDKTARGTVIVRYMYIAVKKHYTVSLQLFTKLLGYFSSNMLK